MLKAADFFVEEQQLARLNEKIVGEVSREHGMNSTELGILMFLANNPQYDTAKEIVEYRGMTKSCVSKAVDSLVRQGYLSTREDDADRRITHLVLEEQAGLAIAEGLQAQERLMAYICQGLSAEEMEGFCKIYNRIMENTKEALKLCGKN